MKKYVLGILSISLTVVLGFNTTLLALDLESHDLSIGIKATSAISQDDEVEGYVLTLPYLAHSFEIELSDSTVLTLDSQADFTLEKVSIAEEAANAVNVEIEPALERSFGEVLSLTASAPFSFSNEKPDEKDAERENSVELVSIIELSYSTMDDELHGISSWDNFQHGFTVTGIYGQQFYSKENGEKAEDLDTSIGVEAEYSYFSEEMFFMLTPSVSVVKHLNTKMDESLEIEGMVEIMKDVNDFLTVGLEIGTNSVKEDTDADFESEVDLGGKVILSKFDDLDISTTFVYSRDISYSDTHPAYTMTLDAEYDIF